MLLFALVLLYGCTGNQGQGGTNPPPPPSPPDNTWGGGNANGGSVGGDSGSAAGSGAGTGKVREFTVEASNWKFEPSTITVNKGDTVKITLVNKDVSHGIAIRDFGFDLKAEAGKSATGQFVASKQGTFDFSCNVFCGDGHREMEGTLVVN